MYALHQLLFFDANQRGHSPSLIYSIQSNLKAMAAFGRANDILRRQFGQSRIRIQQDLQLRSHGIQRGRTAAEGVKDVGGVLVAQQRHNASLPEHLVSWISAPSKGAARLLYPRGNQMNRRTHAQRKTRDHPEP
jgi:hypothetical protein